MLIVGLLSTSEYSRDRVKGRLEEYYGTSMWVGKTLPFTYTDYYNNEMGEGIERDFLAFENLIDPSELAEVKIRCNAIEEEFVDGATPYGAGAHGSAEGLGTVAGRRVNIDPGLLSLGKLILASTKNHAHRIPLKEGIYGEVTLIYRDKSYRSLPWTYADYRSDEYLEVFHRLRKKLKKS